MHMKDEYVLIPVEIIDTHVKIQAGNSCEKFIMNYIGLQTGIEPGPV